MKKAIGYIRVSTEEQGREGVSLEAQAEKIFKYAKWVGLNCALKKEEPITGTTRLAGRPMGRELLEMVGRGEVTDVIVTKQDRLCRDTIDCLTILRDWDEKVVLHIIDEGGVVDTSTPNGWMQVAMRAIIADYEVKNIRHRTLTALRHKKANGQVYGTVPYGYDNVDGQLVENETEQGYIEMMRTWRDDDWTLMAIADELNKNRVPAKLGGPWYAQQVKNVLNYDREMKGEKP